MRLWKKQDLLPLVARLLSLAAVAGVSFFPARSRADTGPQIPAQGAIIGSFFNQTPAALPIRNQPLPMGDLGIRRLSSGPGLCDAAINNANTGHHLPSGLLKAIAVVESGRVDPQDGSRKPWPWTIDANGTGYMYPTEQAAVQAAARFQEAGITALDIGCLQVDLGQHPEAFQNLEQAFDPAANAAYAAGFLNSLEQKFGNWPQAVAAYHSQTPSLGIPYASRVYAAWHQAEGAAFASNEMIPGPNPEGGSPIAALPPNPVQLTALAPPPPAIIRSQNSMIGRSLASYRAAPVPIASAAGPSG
jgi:hypothetical protein